MQRIRMTIILLSAWAAASAAQAATVTANAGRNEITVYWSADWPVKRITVCSNPGQLNPGLICKGNNELGDFVQDLTSSPQSTGSAVLRGLTKNRWHTIKVKGMPLDGQFMKQIGVIKVKTTK